MHRYFVIPVTIFFVFICGFVIYLQFINEDWKYLVPKPILPDSCNDNTDIEFVIHKTDNIVNRSFKDEPDIIDGNQIHAIFLLPCERVDRKYDVNLIIESSLLAINKWFFSKSENQKIKFDRNKKNHIDVTFLRVNKTMLWFDNKTNDNNLPREDVSTKIKKIIFDNKNKFYNFNEKKFIIFFEGWERKKHINFDICGKATFGGKIAIYYTFSRFKKYIGNDLVLKNNKHIFTCNQDDHLNNPNDLSFGDAEVTILHEILHTMAMPPICGKNVNQIIKHVNDSQQDILNRMSGNLYLDYNNDDYYNHTIDSCPDLKNSSYLTQ